MTMAYINRAMEATFKRMAPGIFCCPIDRSQAGWQNNYVKKTG